MAKIIINCLDFVGESMAGPAIRSWEFANQLSKKHSVVLLSPNSSNLKSKNFELKQYNKQTILDEIKTADFLIVQTIRPKTAKLAAKHNVRIILDAYDPISIEALEANKKREIGLRIALNKLILLEQSTSFYFADSIICASEKQRDLWLGVLSSMGKITPKMYDEDNSLRSLIDVVPFGLSSNPPTKNGNHALRKKFNLSDDDFVLLWGGGIWNWFDPISLIEAIALLQKTMQVKLVFMGIDHPNKNIPRMPMVDEAINKAKELNLEGKSVFFNEGWVPYKQREQYLIDADLGVSTHFDHLETRFSFRTRILDYIWASLPIVATTGDSFADFIIENQLGIVVDYNDSRMIAKAIEKIALDKDLYINMKNNLKSVQKDLYWERCVLQIEGIINYWSTHDVEKKLNVKTVTAIFSMLYNAQKIVSKKVLKKIFQIKA